MKYKELAALPPEERAKKQEEAERELMKLKAQVATGTAPKNPHQVQALKKIRARIKTLQNTTKQK